jgi:hypothetical protein
MLIVQSCQHQIDHFQLLWVSGFQKKAVQFILVLNFKEIYEVLHCLHHFTLGELGASQVLVGLEVMIIHVCPFKRCLMIQSSGMLCCSPPVV